jgi:hypothetical protein
MPDRWIGHGHRPLAMERSLDMKPFPVTAKMRTLAAIVLFAFGMLAGSTLGNASASSSSTAPCGVDSKAQAAPTPDWSTPPQSPTGRPGQPY